MAPPQLSLQLADRIVEHCGEIYSGGFGTHGWAPAVAGDHDPLGRLRLARIRLVAQLDVITDGVTIQMIESAEFPCDHQSVTVGPGDVVACDDDLDCRVHLGLPEVVERSSAVAMRSRGMPRGAPSRSLRLSLGAVQPEHLGRVRTVVHRQPVRVSDMVQPVGRLVPPR
jgi:hypothetical protein